MGSLHTKGNSSKTSAVKVSSKPKEHIPQVSHGPDLTSRTLVETGLNLSDERDGSQIIKSLSSM